MHTETFDSAYAHLNEKQKQAVDTIEGPVMVVAGPGTGKTQTLTLRIANILLRTDTAPENILALTFTESAAHSMRMRLVEIVGNAAYKMTITTFHGFCNDVMERSPDDFQRIIGAQHATELAQIRIVEEILHADQYPYLRPYGDPTYYVRSILSAIHHLKREGVTPEQWDALVKEDEEAFYATEDLYNQSGKYAGKMKGRYQTMLRKIEKNKELARVYAAYQEKLREYHLYDYEDMILEVVAQLKENEDLRLTLQEEYHYLLADEYQDTNAAQNELLALLADFHESPNVFVVGDEKQAVYRFQGASLENFRAFREQYPTATLITLDENYRSPQTVLDSAHGVITNTAAHDPLLHTPLTAAAKGQGSPVDVYAFPDPEHERQFVVETVQEKINEGVSPSEIAILYRTNREAHDLVRALEKTEIPFHVASDQQLLADAEMQKLLILLRGIASLGDDARLTVLLHLDIFALDPLDVYKVSIAARAQRKNMYDILRSANALERADVADPDAFTALYQKLAAWKRAAENEGLLACFERIVRESGYLDALLVKPGAFDLLAKLDRIFEEMKAVVTEHRNASLADFLDHIDTLETYGVSISAQPSTVHEGVHLMTAHRAKGREFEYVYMTGVTYGKWGGRRRRSDFRAPSGSVTVAFQGDDHDERRLFYVALTRARTHATITYPLQNADGKGQIPSQFVEEIDPQYLRWHEHSASDDDRTKEEHPFNRPQSNKGPGLADAQYLRERFCEQGLSITAVNNYRECPWRYFYDNLVRIPKPYTKTQAYGNVIHAALKTFFDRLQKGETVGKQFLVDQFIRELDRQPLPDHEYRELYEKGTRALSGYYDTHEGTWNTNVATEFTINGVAMDVSDPDGNAYSLPLRGTMDKIEWEDDTRVNVVDYKASRPKTRNEIEGNTKNARGNEKRQLVFYKLLLEAYAPERFIMQSGEIDFIEPDGRTETWKKERFGVTPEEVDALQEEIERIAREILTFSFWEWRCEEQCSYCAMREMMGE